MIAFAVATLVFINAVAIGINDSMIINSTKLYTGQITGINFPAALKPNVFFIKGVTDVLQRFRVPGVAEHKGHEASILLVAVAPLAEKKANFLWKKIVHGSYFSGDKMEILISLDTAEKLGIQPGQTMVFEMDSKKIHLTVAGIFKTGIDNLDRGIAFCKVAALPEKPAFWDCAIFLEPETNPDAIIAEYAGKGLGNLDLKTWKELMPGLTQLIDLNRISMGFVMVLVLCVVSFGTACAFAIFIISRIREYGIMKAMGVLPMEIVLMIFSEVALMNLGASCLGTLIGFLVVLISGKTGIDLTAFTSHNPYFAVSGLIIPRTTFFSLFLPAILALFFCLSASIWPILIVLRQKPSNILKSI